MKKISISWLSGLCLILGISSNTFAQDPQFTQIYASPLYLNPAFAGNLEYDCRKLPASRYKSMINYRSQYSGEFNTVYGSVDYREKTGRMGIGGIFISDRMGSVPLTTTMVGLIGSYKIPITNDWHVQMGLQGNFYYRTVDFTSFTFPDQFSKIGLTSNTNEPLINGSQTTYLDFATGVLLYNENLFLGGAAHHINQPNQSLYDQKDQLPLKVAAHGGYRLLFRKAKGFGKSKGPEQSLTPTVHFKSQGNFNQLDLGTFYNYDPLILGIWYRGLPIFTTPDNSLNQEALCFLAAAKIPSDYGLIRVGVSYDIPLSSKVNNLGRTFELSLSYQFINERCRKRVVYKKIPCPG